jgi:hypothetical protein
MPLLIQGEIIKIGDSITKGISLENKMEVA